MFKLALVVLLCSQAYARLNNEINNRVIGGIPATEGQFPYVVSLRVGLDYDFCAGALVSNRFVLTSANCVVPFQTLKVGVGSVFLSKLKYYDVQKIIFHPSFNPNIDPKHFDIALLKLQSPVPLGGNIQTINFDVTENLNRQNATALGWGYTTIDGPDMSPTLMYITRPIIKNRECTLSLNEKIDDTQICLGSDNGHGMCYGDSGSPLVYKGTNGKYYAVGLVSWGIPCAKGYPDVFTRVSYFADWIKQNIF